MQRVLRREMLTFGGRKFPVCELIEWGDTPASIDMALAHLQLGLPVVLLRIGGNGGTSNSRYTVIDSRTREPEAMYNVAKWFKGASAHCVRLGQYAERNKDANPNQSSVSIPQEP